MSDKFTVGQLFPNIQAPLGPQKRTSTPAKVTPEGQNFQQVFQDSLLRFSHHAEVRLQQRGISLKPEQLSKLESAIDKAAAKGAKESLVLFNNMALIVNVKNRTVVTAMDDAAMKDHVFTHIDSAVIIP